MALFDDLLPEHIKRPSRYPVISIWEVQKLQNSDFTCLNQFESCYCLSLKSGKKKENSDLGQITEIKACPAAAAAAAAANRFQLVLVYF